MDPVKHCQSWVFFVNAKDGFRYENLCHLATGKSMVGWQVDGEVSLTQLVAFLAHHPCAPCMYALVVFTYDLNGLNNMYSTFTMNLSHSCI